MKKDLEIIKNCESQNFRFTGDFLLSGYRIIGKVFCYQGGHELTNLFLKKVFKTKTAFQVEESKDFKATKKFHHKELEKIAVNA